MEGKTFSFNWKTSKSLWKYFGYRSFGFKSDLKDCKDAALAYRKKRSDELGKTRNRYRILVDDSDGQRYIEVELCRENGKIWLMKADVEDLPVVERYTWGKWSGYAKTKCKLEDGTLKTLMFHRLVCPDLTDDLEVDHKSRDKLDNRKKNLRAVTHSANNRNRTVSKNNKSGVTGVSKSGNSWVATWVGDDGKTKKRSFVEISATPRGFMTEQIFSVAPELFVRRRKPGEAFALAVKARTEAAMRTNNDNGKFCGWAEEQKVLKKRKLNDDDDNETTASEEED